MCCGGGQLYSEARPPMMMAPTRLSATLDVGCAGGPELGAPQLSTRLSSTRPTCPSATLKVGPLP
jgi:hypothetical protein